MPVKITIKEPTQTTPRTLDQVETLVPVVVKSRDGQISVAMKVSFEYTSHTYVFFETDGSIMWGSEENANTYTVQEGVKASVSFDVE